MSETNNKITWRVVLSFFEIAFAVFILKIFGLLDMDEDNP